MKWEEIFKKYAVDTLEFIKSGKDVALTQGQLYIHELIKWEIVSSLICAFVFTLLSILALIIARKLQQVYKSEVARLKRNCEGWAVLTIISTFIAVCFSCAMIISVANATKAYVAPRVVVMEKLQGMIK